jgi:nitric oxide reductase large subunit
MPVVAMAPSKQRSRLSIAFTSSARVLFTTLLFTAGGMGFGLFLGIIGMTAYALLHGGNVDMTHAYKHVALPIAFTLGAIAFCGAIYLEVRSRRTSH